MRIFLFVAVLQLFSLCSCNLLDIEKRHYRDGFYVNAKSANSATCGNAKLSSNETRGLTQIHPDTLVQTTHNADTSLCSQQHADLRDSMGLSSDVKPVNASKVLSPKVTIEKPVPPVEDPVEHQIKAATILGTIALIFIVLGIIGLEATAYLFPLLLIGIGCAIFGMRMGKMALQNTKFTEKKSDKPEPNPKRKRAKNAYLLSLSSILILMAYVILRVALSGAGSIGIAITLLAVCLALFVLFKIGVFTDLSD